MADQNKIVYNINVNAEQGTATIRNLNGQIVATQVPVSDLRREFGNFAKQVNAADFSKFNKGIDKVKTRLDGSSKAAGASTSATLELGRVLSDMPYGIRGVANNVQQLASNLFFMSKATDESTGKAIGFKGAIGGLLKNLLGPAGVLVAFQGIIALFDHFSSGAKKAKEQVEGLTQGFTKLLSKLDDLQGVLPDALSGLLERIGINGDDSGFVEFNKGLNTTLKILNNEFPEFKKAYDNLSETQKKDPDVISKLIGKYRELINVRKDIVEKEESIRRIKEVGGKHAEYNLKTSQEAYKSLILRKIELENIFKKEEKIAKLKKRDKVEYFDIKSLEEGRGKIIAEIMKTEEKIALLSTKNKAARLVIQRDFHLRRLMAVDGANSELIKSYEKYYAKLISLAEENPAEIDLSFGDRGGASPEEIKERQRLLTQVKLEALMESSQAIAGFIDGEFQREITVERNKTNALNNELRERLNNENISKSERKSIQLEIARNDEALRKKQEKIEKKRFKMQKAANVSQALISTYLAVAQVQANPLDLNPITKGISMAATLAAGLANVATLARQKFQSSAGATSTAGALGGGGSGGNDRSFNFNLAGASRENQLASTLQGRFDQPLQAYVVSRDITNQQQLDQDILTNASFG